MAASASVKSFQVVITTPTVLKVTAEPIASHVPEYISTKKIKYITPIYYDYTTPLPSVAASPVLAYNTTPNKITIGGNHAIELFAGDSIVISGSTSNDGTYTVISAVNSGVNTVITVLEPIISIPVDGTLAYTPHTGTAAADGSQAQFQETYPYARMTVLAITLLDNTIMRWELQSITNQPTWSLGTPAALAVATAAIAALI